MTVGIIIAAGLGSRMGALTDDRPKCMLPVAGRPLLHHTIDRLRDVGCNKIVVVVGYKSDRILAADCVIVANPNYVSNNILHSLICARDHLIGDVVCSYSDIWLEPEVLSDLSNTPGDIVAAVDVDWEPYYIGRSEHPLSEAENVFIDANNAVQHIGKHLQPASAGEFKCGEFLGLWRMSPVGTERFVTHFEKLNKNLAPLSPFQGASEWQKAYITDLFQDMIDCGAQISSSLTQRRWAELDTRQDFERLLGIAERQRLRTLVQ
jgi:choline kinase